MAGLILLILPFFLLNFLILVLAPRYIPYLGFFPYKEIIPTFNLPSFLNPLANFDGVHYLLIAIRGYVQYEQAFFPLYPLLLKLFSFLTHPFVSALLISQACLVAGLALFHKLLHLNRLKSPLWVIAFLLFFPASFFFSAVYTESLFFLLFVAALYFLQRQKYFFAFIAGALAALARLMGLFLIIPLLVHFFSVPPQKRSAKSFMVVLSPLVGFFAYAAYLYATTGDPLFFFHSQPAFGANRSTRLILLPQVIYRYLKIFFIAAPDFKYFVAVFEFIIFLVFLMTLLYQLFFIIKSTPRNPFLLGLNLFSLVNLLLPTLTGTFSSIPRYSLLSLSFFIFLAQLKNSSLKLGILLLFIILHTLAFAFFVQGYFIA
ncbi:MAG: hypothetical protein WC686_01185 [Candidatus Shapirobacteria bacterium]|jgi:hypothetical protein